MKPASQPVATPAPEAASVKKAPKAPLMLILAIIGFVLSLGTPRFLLFFPLMATLGFAVASIYRRERGRIGAALVLVLTIGVWALSSVDPQTLRAAAPASSVTYFVEGSARSASLTYSNEQGGTEQDKVMLPWQKTMSVKEGRFLYLSAQNQDQYGDITVRITVNGREVKRSTATGAYSIASASGSCCASD
jgi:hypothetical protein